MKFFKMIFLCFSICSFIYSAEAQTTEKKSKVDEFPRMFSQECEDLEGEKDRKACGDKKMLEYIYRNLNYPESSKKNKVGGTAVVSFYVETDGSLTDIQVLRGLDKEIDAECIRLVSSMPKWTPGKLDGEAVRVSFNLPIIFRLEEKSYSGGRNRYRSGG